MKLRMFVSVLVAATGTASAQFFPAPCFTVTGPCASEPTSLLQKIIMAENLAQTVLILGNLVKNSIKGGPTFGNIASELAVLNRAVLYGRGLAYSMGQIDQKWAAAYPGVTSLSGYPAGGYSGQYAKWARTANDSLVGAMMASSQAANMRFSSAQGVLNAIRVATMSADGWLRAQHAIAAAADQTNENLLALHQIGLAQVQTMATFSGYQIQKDAAHIKAEEDFLRFMQPTKDTTQIPAGFGDLGKP